MTHPAYPRLKQILTGCRFTRVERDDRLLDVFPGQRREKGWELWEYWASNVVFLIRIHEPENVQVLDMFSIPRRDLERALRTCTTLLLATFPHRLIASLRQSIEDCIREDLASIPTKASPSH